MDNQKQEEVIRRILAKGSLHTTLVGIAIWITPLVYALVLVLIILFEGGTSSPGIKGLGKYLTAIATATLVLSIIAVPLTIKLYNFLLRQRDGRLSPLDKATSGIDTNTLIQDYPEAEGLVARYGIYFRSSLIASALAEFPAIFALIVALMAIFNGKSIFSNTYVFVPIITMWLIALFLSALVVPNAKRLEMYLRNKGSEQDENIAPPLQ